MTEDEFECGICSYEFKLEEQVWIDPNDHDLGSMCRTCTKIEFQKAYYKKDDDPDKNWGLKWANRYLRAQDYSDVLGAEFVALYEPLDAKFRVLKMERVFCPHPGPIAGRTCDAFVGAAQHGAGDNQKACRVCGRKVCLSCRQGSMDDEHMCPGPPEVNEAEEEDPNIPSWMVRGRHYQKCPRCNDKGAQPTDCNWVKCEIVSCGAGYCYICGKEAQHGHPYAHWQEIQPDGSTGCPLWGGAGSELERARVFANPRLMFEDEDRWFRVDMTTVKLHIQIVLDAEDPGLQLRCPRWILNLPNDWDVVFRFVNGQPHQLWSFTPHVPQPTISFREMTRMETLSDYLRYNSRCFKTLHNIRQQSPAHLIEVDPPNERWPLHLENMFSHQTLDQKQAQHLYSMDMTEFFLLSERAANGSRPSHLWTRHVPRNTIIYFWQNVPGYTTPEAFDPNNIVEFATLCNDRQVRAPQSTAALTSLERMLTSSPAHLLLAYGLEVNANFDLNQLPPVSPGDRTPEYYYVTLELSQILRIAPLLAAAGRIAAPLPVWWYHPAMPQDTQLVLKYLRDGQAFSAFQGAEIVGAFLTGNVPDESRQLLTQICRYVKFKQENEEKFLETVLLYEDINIFTSTLTEQELSRAQSSTYRNFDGQDLR